MNEHFMEMVASATTSKEQFDNSMETLKGSLRKSVVNSCSIKSYNNSRTGWLKGSLSYPWVLLCSIAPAIKELF